MGSCHNILRCLVLQLLLVVKMQRLMSESVQIQPAQHRDGS
jgi:hypothetical protein